MRGGKRSGAGRKPGTPNRPKSEIRKDRALREMERVAREQARKARLEAEADAAAERAGRKAEREAQRPPRAEKVVVEILPPLHGLNIPADVEPLDFLKHLMRNADLPLGFRRDCAALALPYAHAKPVVGMKDMRRLAAFDDDGDDEIAAAMRN